MSDINGNNDENKLNGNQEDISGENKPQDNNSKDNNPKDDNSQGNPQDNRPLEDKSQYRSQERAERTLNGSPADGGRDQKIRFSQLLTRREFLAVFFVFAGVLAILVYTFFSPNYYTRPAPIRFEIYQGESFSQVIDSLYAYGIIPGKKNMRIAGIVYAADKRIKAGRYKIPNGLSYVSLLELLIKGEREVPALVTFQEGITIRQFAHILQKKVHADSAEVMRLCTDTSFISSLGLKANSLEGYLLPESYYIYDLTPPEKIIRRLRSEFEKFFSDSLKQQLSESKYNLHQILTVASIVEGESNKVAEFPIIAGVYYNRLEQGMKLQADPTVQYAFEGRWKRLYNKDLLVNSPYNTYINYGLPPGPINNPGKAAILAALFPAKHNFVYFVADGTGGHKFSATYDEHLKSIALYRGALQQQFKNSSPAK